MDSQEQSNPGPLPMQRKKPKRPMSAYNFFFQDEHRRMKDEFEAAEAAAEAAEEAKAKAAGEEPPKKEARKKKKIPVADLGKAIGRRWKEISEDDLAAYTRRAAEDTERYKLEAEAYYKGQIDDMCMRNISEEKEQQQDNDVEQVQTKRKKKRRKKNKNEPSTIPAGNQGASILPFQLNQTLSGNPMLFQEQLMQFQAPRQQRQLSANAELIQAQVQMQQHQQNQFEKLMGLQMLQMMQFLQAQQQQQQQQEGSGTDGSNADGQ